MKGKGFKKLRLTGSSAIGASMLLAGGAASRVLADDSKSGQEARGGFFTTITRFGIDWAVSNSVFENGITGLGFTDASFTTAVATTGGSTATLNDAFDDCELMGVDGTGYSDPDGVLDLNGDVLTGSPTTLSGLTVSRELRWHDAILANGTRVVRSLNTFTNPSGSPISVTVNFECNLGSDSNTFIEGTSNGSGNVPVTDDNLWYVTSDEQPYGDPPVTFVRYGTGAAVTAVFDTGNDGPHEPGDDDASDSYALTVPAGETRHILRYIGLSNGGGASLADAPTFENLASLNTAGLLAGIPPTELSGNIANFGPLAAPTPASIPSMSRIGTWLLAGALGLLAVFGLRRRTSAG